MMTFCSFTLEGLAIVYIQVDATDYFTFKIVLVILMLNICPISEDVVWFI